MTKNKELTDDNNIYRLTAVERDIPIYVPSKSRKRRRGRLDKPSHYN